MCYELCASTSPAPTSRPTVKPWLIVAILAGTFVCQAVLGQEGLPVAGAQTAIAPSGSTSSASAKIVTPAQIDVAIERPSRGPAGLVNRPTIPLDEYRAAKAAAAGLPREPGTTLAAPAAGTF